MVVILDWVDGIFQIKLTPQGLSKSQMTQVQWDGLRSQV